MELAQHLFSVVIDDEEVEVETTVSGHMSTLRASFKNVFEKELAGDGARGVSKLLIKLKDKKTLPRVKSPRRQSAVVGGIC